MNNQRNRNLNLIALLLAGSISVGCNGEDPVVGPDETPDNVAENNDPANNDPANNDPANNDPANNDPANNDPTNNLDPMGDVGFMTPTGDTIYTNGDVDIEIVKTGDAQDIELVLDEEQVITEFADTMTYTWDTSSLVEGNYDLALRFNIGGSDRWAFDTKAVVIDRTAPTIADRLPVVDSSDNASDAPIAITFSEPMDPDSFDPTTSVLVDFSSGDAPSYTLELSADGTVLTIDFDRSAVATPYQATVELTGVRDLAGNAFSDRWSWDVPHWKASTFGDGLVDLHYAEHNGQQFVFGINHASPDELVALKDTPAASWVKVATQEAAQVYDIDTYQVDELVYVAVNRQFQVLNSFQQAVVLYSFDMTTEEFTSEGYTMLGADSGSGAVSLDMRPLGTSAHGSAIAATSAAGLQVFQYLNADFSLETNMLHANDSYDYIRHESLSVHIKADNFPEVIFARCANDSDPCVNTIIEKMELANSGWDEFAGVLKTTLKPGISNDCDEFVNFEATYVNDVATLLFAHQGTCDDLAPNIEALEAGASDWTMLGGQENLLTGMRNVGTAPFSTRIATGPNGTRWALVGSREQLHLLQFDGTSSTYVASVGGELTTSLNLPSAMLLNPKLHVTESGEPVVLFRHGNQVHVYRTN